MGTQLRLQQIFLEPNVGFCRELPGNLVLKKQTVLWANDDRDGEDESGR